MHGPTERAQMHAGSAAAGVGQRQRAFLIVAGSLNAHGRDSFPRPNRSVFLKANAVMAFKNYVRAIAVPKGEFRVKAVKEVREFAFGNRNGS